MNKEVINKYKEAFDYWLSGGDLWCRLETEVGKWTHIPTHKDIFPMGTMAIYVQDDEYAELRKAQADGKVIQWRDKNKENWTDYRPEDYTYWANDVARYRIKPDEPTFKVGDWVRHGDAIEFLSMPALDYYGENSKVLEIWKPQPNEWCWFWDYSTRRDRSL